MWTMLNNLHESDPASYDSFIQQQFKEMKESVNKGKTIVPSKGFVVKAFIVDLNKNQKARESKRGQTKKLFVNFCHHEAVAVPIDSNGEKVTEETTNVANAKIPMVISKLRDFKDSSGHDARAVDTVLHLWCLKRSFVSSSFKSQMIVLGLKCVEEEWKVTVQTNKWKLIKSAYKGGTGLNGADVHPFPVDEKVLQSRSDGEGSGISESVSSFMNDPQSLLHSLRKSYSNTQDEFRCLNNEENKTESKRALIGEIETKTQTIVALIEEIDEKVDKAEITKLNISEETEIPLAKQMKGFLNKRTNKSRALYQKSSTGDGLEGTGGNYSKFMSKCQVIDTVNISKQRTYADKASSVENRSFANGIKKGFLSSKDGCFDNEKVNTVILMQSLIR